jgi:hypothetical protein
MDGSLALDPASRPAASAVRALPRSQPRGASLLRHAPSLVLSLVPGGVFAGGLAALAGTARFAWVARLESWPWQLWAIALLGTAATSAGVLDWAYHRQAGITVGKHERRAELLALALGGVPLFLLMAGATLSSAPLDFLVPVLAVLVATTVMVAYDEVAFHRRRCAPVEHLLHRVLTLGHLGAFLAWAHWVFVVGGGS